MGNKEPSIKGIAYRIVSIREKSPLQRLVEPFFDFITEINVEPNEQITGESSKNVNTVEINPIQKPLLTRIKEHQGKEVVLKIYSSKHQTFRNVQFIPNSNWNDSGDLIGITFRKQNYLQIRSKYTRIENIQSKSPVDLAHFKQGDYLIGAVEFKYESITQLIDTLYEIYYDKEILSKVVHFATYNLREDKLTLKSVQLNKKWGGNGLLGCGFAEGHLYKFPKNLSQVRSKLIIQQKLKTQTNIARSELLNSDGTSKMLAESLKRKNASNAQNHKKIHIRNPEYLEQIKKNKIQLSRQQALQEEPINNSSASFINPIQLEKKPLAEQQKPPKPIISLPNNLEERIARLQVIVSAIQKSISFQEIS